MQKPSETVAYLLPDLSLENNDEYEAVWALVDSRAGANVANKAVHFPGAKCEPFASSEKPVRLSTASGEEMVSSTKFTIQGRTAEGRARTTTFVDAKVDMPILAVSDLSKEGKFGSNIGFDTHGGAITDKITNAKSSFIKVNGVFYENDGA